MEKSKKILVTGKVCPKISQEEFVKALGAEKITDPKEIEKLKKKLPRRP